VRKTIIPALAIGLLSLVLSACNVAALPVAARVGGAAISSAQLHAVLVNFDTSTELRCIITQSSSPMIIDGKGSGTFNAAFTAKRLNDLIEAQIDAAIIATYHLQSNAFVDQTADSEVNTAFSSQQIGNCATEKDLLSTLDPTYRDLLLTEQRDQILIDGYLLHLGLSPAGIHAYELAHVAEMTTSCFSDIAVSSKAKAQQVETSLAAGGNFAALAKAESIDTSDSANGGSFGCYLPADLFAPVNEIAAALRIGGVSAPISVSGSWVILEKTSTQSLATTAAAAQVLFESEVGPENVFIDKFSRHLTITVNPQYGSWTSSSQGQQVSVPSVPASTLLLNPSAINPVG
jgi:parvulin-like peptidyl-prolyl isomerase